MSPLRILVAACAVLTLASCGTGRVDSSYPTAAELDRLDTQWGLTPRRSRGAPKRTFQYNAANAAAYNAPAASAPAAAPEAPSAPAAPATPAPELDPATVNSLR